MFKETSLSLACACSVILFSFCNKSAEIISTSPVNSADTSAYKLVWSDEFNNSTIDTNTWNFESGGDGWGNHELEYYQQQNATIESGNLVITAKKQMVGNNKYTSARMTTLGKKEFKYGRIEARIKIPVGKGFWPAFWMMGSNIQQVNWPACGENDIMEHINADSIFYGTLHWDSSGHVYHGGKTISPQYDYHVYGVEWTSTSIKWFVDSVQYFQQSITDSSATEFQKPFFILLNLAIGGDWPGQTVDESLMPAKMYVDYVRVYQK